MVGTKRPFDVQENAVAELRSKRARKQTERAMQWRQDKAAEEYVPSAKFQTPSTDAVPGPHTAPVAAAIPSPRPKRSPQSSGAKKRHADEAVTSPTADSRAEPAKRCKVVIKCASAGSSDASQDCFSTQQLEAKTAGVKKGKAKATTRGKAKAKKGANAAGKKPAAPLGPKSGKACKQAKGKKGAIKMTATAVVRPTCRSPGHPRKQRSPKQGTP